MKKVIVLLTQNEIEVYSTLTGLCKAKGLSYNYLKKLKFPIHYRSYVIYKEELRQVKT